MKDEILHTLKERIKLEEEEIKKLNNKIILKECIIRECNDIVKSIKGGG